MLTLIGSRVPELITGALLVETVFSRPGIAAAPSGRPPRWTSPLLAALLALGHDPVLLERWCDRTTHRDEVVKD
ncbi:hypothetical protein J2Z77_006445 [Streptomyces avidinii]|uniref:Uncharacterized protein n=1 Tax=Streptomyces avidinii TaxID=1895 RepID=A0ABS4LF12_STRAV|nr:hypothetical protein [Streptomyces avidinii]